MIIKGDNYNFGRVVYLTISRNMVNTQSTSYTKNEKSDVVTIVFDPKTNPKLNTRIDFWVKHTGQSMSTSANSAYALAKIDVYNIGAALKQFMDAYNLHSGGIWLEDKIKRYACSLQVGYYGGKRTTIFTGFISSWYVERLQNETTVDNVWHLYAQYPNTDIKFISSEDKATNGENYAQKALQEIPQTFITGEEYLKAAVMAFPRETYSFVAMPEDSESESFSVIDLYGEKLERTNLVAMPATREINQFNFNQFFTIKYQYFRTGKEYPEIKRMWQKQEPMEAWRMDYSVLSNALSEIAAKKNCHATIQLDENTGMQTIYIYPAGKPEYSPTASADYTIVDFQNLRRQPGVAGRGLQLDMLLEPSLKPGDTIQLEISKNFYKTYKDKISFQPNFADSMSSATTVFAGANFAGSSNILTDAEKLNSMSETGNVFGNKYVSVFVVHSGSTHTSEWSTQVECWGVVVNDGTIK